MYFAQLFIKVSEMKLPAIVIFRIHMKAFFSKMLSRLVIGHRKYIAEGFWFDSVSISNDSAIFKAFIPLLGIPHHATLWNGLQE